jgi:hypothetical protein
MFRIEIQPHCLNLLKAESLETPYNKFVNESQKRNLTFLYLNIDINVRYTVYLIFLHFLDPGK